MPSASLSRKVIQYAHPVDYQRSANESCGAGIYYSAPTRTYRTRCRDQVAATRKSQVSLCTSPHQNHGCPHGRLLRSCPCPIWVGMCVGILCESISAIYLHTARERLESALIVMALALFSYSTRSFSVPQGAPQFGMRDLRITSSLQRTSAIHFHRSHLLSSITNRLHSVPNDGSHQGA